MEKEMAVCPVCGKKFQKRMSRQKYCSTSCGRYANKHDETIHDEKPGAEVIRTFCCKRCGELVQVTDPLDKRLKFCSQYCEKLFWKHPEKAEAIPVERVFVCRGCGKTVKVTSAFDRRHTFCSKKCQQNYVARMSAKAHSNLAPEEGARRCFICKECGKKVQVKEKSDRRRLYCSVECRDRHMLQKAKLRKKKK